MKRLKKLSALLIASSLACSIAHAMHQDPHGGREVTDGSKSRTSPPHHAAFAITDGQEGALQEKFFESLVAQTERQELLSPFKPGVLTRAIREAAPIFTEDQRAQLYGLQARARTIYTSIPQSSTSSPQSSRAWDLFESLLRATDTLIVQVPIEQRLSALHQQFYEQHPEIRTLLMTIQAEHEKDPAFLRHATETSLHRIGHGNSDPASLPLSIYEFVARSCFFTETSLELYFKEMPRMAEALRKLEPIARRSITEGNLKYISLYCLWNDYTSARNTIRHALKQLSVVQKAVRQEEASESKDPILPLLREQLIVIQGILTPTRLPALSRTTAPSASMYATSGSPQTTELPTANSLTPSIEEVESDTGSVCSTESSASTFSTTSDRLTSVRTPGLTPSTSFISPPATPTPTPSTLKRRESSRATPAEATPTMPVTPSAPATQSLPTVPHTSLVQNDDAASMTSSASSTKPSKSAREVAPRLLDEAIAGIPDDLGISGEKSTQAARILTRKIKHNLAGELLKSSERDAAELKRAKEIVSSITSKGDLTTLEGITGKEIREAMMIVLNARKTPSEAARVRWAQEQSRESQTSSLNTSTASSSSATTSTPQKLK